MVGEKDLEKLLCTMNPTLHEGVFVFCAVTTDQLPPFLEKSIFFFREEEGTTLVMLREDAERLSLSFQCPSRLITLNVHSSLEAVGFLAVITKSLADKGISINVVSAFYHDHLFVPENRADEAMDLLKSRKSGLYMS